MKKVRWCLPLAVIMIMAMSCKTTGQLYGQDEVYQQDENYDDYQNNNDVSYDAFYNGLSPYGRWVDYPSYGRVWICNEPDFRPYYSNGHWALTNYGWTWVSDYRWGWAPFHYGRWAFDNAYGWFWVPGYEWAPAWVSWRTGGDYYGWAPLSPGLNISIGVSFGSGIPVDRWCFVPHRYITAPRINSYCVNRSQNTVIVRNTTIINNVNVYRNNRFESGPDRRQVEQYTGQRLNPVRVYNSNRPDRDRFENNSLHVYRPVVRQNNVSANNNVDNNNRIINRPDRNSPAQQPDLRNGNRPVIRSSDAVINRADDRQPQYNNINRNNVQPAPQQPVSRPLNPAFNNNNNNQRMLQQQPDFKNRNNTDEPVRIIRERQRQEQRDIAPNRNFTPNRSFTPNRQMPTFNRPVQQRPMSIPRSDRKH